VPADQHRDDGKRRHRCQHVGQAEQQQRLDRPPAVLLDRGQQHFRRWPIAAVDRAHRAHQADQQQRGAQRPDEGPERDR
jgi:hypothetical protein